MFLCVNAVVVMEWWVSFVGIFGGLCGFVCCGWGHLLGLDGVGFSGLGWLLVDFGMVCSVFGPVLSCL